MTRLPEDARNGSRRAPKGRRAQPFAVLFQGRSGSTFLVEALNAHPHVEAGYEAMAARKSKKDTPEQQLEHARATLTSPERSRTRAVGFKTKLVDLLDPLGFAELLRELDARIIVLTRRNLVKLTVSLFNAERIREGTGDWNLYDAHAQLSEPFAIEPDEFARWLQWEEEARAALWQYAAEVSRPTLTLYYEDVLQHPQETVALCFRFLGVDPIVTAGKTIKSGRDDLRELLTNFDELRARFADTRYEAMFDEVLVPS